MQTIGEEKVRDLFALGGITVSTNKEELKNPWDIHVLNKLFFIELLSNGSLGLGESYCNGWWKTGDLRLLGKKLLESGLQGYSQNSLTSTLLRMLFNFQTKSKSARSIPFHYDKGREFFQSFLDSLMVYSCGYWEGTESLEVAQIQKLRLICEKIGLKKDEKEKNKNKVILDVGCGSGGFAKYASEQYGVSVVGVTLSHHQADYAKQLCKDLPIEIRLQDYRDVKGQFDHVVSVGMFEHVGLKNYGQFFQTVHNLLKDDPKSLFLLHTIGGNTSSVITDPWIDKYIFPDSLIPSMAQIVNSFEGLFVMEDWHNFGAYYDKTLMAWWDNFEKNYYLLPKDKYPKGFYLETEYYFKMCAASFAARYNNLWQIVLSKKGFPGGYPSIR